MLGIPVMGVGILSSRRLFPPSLVENNGDGTERRIDALGGWNPHSPSIHLIEVEEAGRFEYRAVALSRGPVELGNRRGRAPAGRCIRGKEPGGREQKKKELAMLSSSRCRPACWSA